MVWYIIALVAIVIDQLTKYIIVHNIDQNTSVTIINNVFYLTNIKNTGAAWSLFQNGRPFFLVLTVIVSIVLVYYLKKSYNNVLSLGISLILGGAIGNFIDRLLFGGVTDFLHFYIGTYSYPVFNAADCFVVSGTIILGYYILFIYKGKDSREDYA